MKSEKRKNELKNLTISEFTKKAESYDSAGMFEMVKIDYDEIINEILNEPYNILVDYGCGTGELLNRLYKIDPTKRYIGIDITPEILEIARKKNNNIEYILGDSEVIMTESNSVDTIICIHSFHHYTNPILFMENAKQSLKSGGRLILRDNSSNSIVKYLFMNFFIYPIYHLRGKGDFHFYSKKEITDMCNKIGMLPEKVEIRGGNKLHCVLRKA